MILWCCQSGSIVGCDSIGGVVLTLCLLFQMEEGGLHVRKRWIWTGKYGQYLLSELNTTGRLANKNKSISTTIYLKWFLIPALHLFIIRLHFYLS